MTDDTTLVNLHRDHCTRHIDRRSRFGNPFEIVEEPTTDSERPYDCHGEMREDLAETHEPQQELLGT
jgi:agmatine/peptidylarginine deiminase